MNESLLYKKKVFLSGPLIEVESFTIEFGGRVMGGGDAEAPLHKSHYLYF